MNFVIFDLEWNSCYSKKTKSFINEIIEFGAVKVDEKMNITDKFSVIVRPQIGKRLSSSIAELTNLTDEEVSRGYPFEYSLKKFSKFTRNCLVMSWSTSDILALMQNSRYYLGRENLPFIKRYMDLQAYCQDMLISNSSSVNQLGLIAAAEMLGIDTSNIPHHRALYDSIVSFMCFKKLYSRPCILSYIQDASSEEFYKRLNFRPKYATGFDDPAVNKERMFFNCRICGKRMKQVNKWETKNKAFLSEFYCENCQKSFSGKIQFRKKYDSVKLIKKLSDVLTESDKQDDDFKP